MSQLKVNTIRHTSASSDAITLASDGTATAKITNNLSNRNIIINGGMLVAQRGTSSTSTGFGSVDRWQISTASTDELAFVQRQLDDHPDGFSQCFEFDVTTAESALAVDELVYARYKVEAQDLRPFYNSNGSGKNFTLSFWVKTKQTGTYQVSIHKEDNTTRFVNATYAVSSADTWEKKSITFTGDSGTTGVNADNGQGFDITWKLAAGSNYTSGGTQTSWSSFGNTVFAGGHAVNVLDNTANYWRITGVQLEVGDVATDFEHRSYGDELLRCYRYFYMHANATGDPITNGMMSSSTDFQGIIQFPVRMRNVPTLKWVTSGSNPLLVYCAGSLDFCNDAGKVHDSETCMAINHDDGLSLGSAGQGAWSRLYNDTTTIGFDAEI